MYVRSIEIDDINLEDEKYCIGNTEPDNNLTSSLKLIGQINPVTVTSTNDDITLVTGWKRVLALRKSGRKEVTAKVIPSERVSAESLLFTIYTDNKERFTELDKAELVNKFRVLYEYSDEEILNSVFPNISVKPSKHNLKKFTSVAMLDNGIKKLFYDDHLTFEQLVMLSELQDEHYRKVIFERVFKKLRFNNNETREILREVYEIAKRESISYESCIESLLPGSSTNVNKNELKKMIKFRRYPGLSEAEQKFSERSKRLESVDSIKLFHHPYFETNEIELRIRVKDIAELKKTVEKLSDKEIESDMESLLELVKKGE